MQLLGLHENAALERAGAAGAVSTAQGGGELVDYQFNSKVAHHQFCRHCGIHAFEWVDVPNMSGGVYYNVSIACLDGVDVDELVSAPIEYCDGLNNDWGAVPAETRHL